MRNYRRFALWTVAATYFLIFVGGLVRVAGAGMGCPDWPKCFGSWIPPLSLSDLPAEIDPATFNVTLAWIEWTNRLVGMTVGFLILGVAMLALRHYRKQPRVLYSSLLAALLVAFQGWQGSMVVASELKPLIVTVHLVLALVIVCLLVYAVLRSYQRSPESTDNKSAVPKQMRWLSKIIWFGIAGQIILGAQVRQAIEAAAAKFPNSSGMESLELAGAIKDVHTIFGILVLGLAVYIGWVVKRFSSEYSNLARLSVATMVVLGILLAFTGMLLKVIGIPALIDLFHLWLAALFICVAMVFNSEITQPLPVTDGIKFSMRRIVIGGATVLVILGGLAYVVIDQAEQSRSGSQSESGLLSE